MLLHYMGSSGKAELTVGLCAETQSAVGTFRETFEQKKWQVQKPLEQSLPAVFTASKPVETEGGGRQVIIVALF